jgi:hypothetical protein
LRAASPDRVPEEVLIRRIPEWRDWCFGGSALSRRYLWYATFSESDASTAEDCASPLTAGSPTNFEAKLRRQSARALTSGAEFLAGTLETSEVYLLARLSQGADEG